MDETLLRSLVWTDYRLAVLFTVLLPIVLLVWAAIKRSEAIVRLLIIYWRVASLLLITVYILIPAWRYGFLSGFAAKLLIPISLWFWADINDEIRDLRPNRLKVVFTSWRWAITIYSSLGAVASIPFLSCAFSEAAMTTPSCRVWLEAPLFYKQLIHPNQTPGFLGFLGMTGLAIYIVYFAYFILVRLGKQGRSALEQ